MSTLLSDHLKATRDALREKSGVGLYFLPGRVASLIKRLNTLVAIAEEQEEELTLLRSAANDLSALPGPTILRHPTRIIIVPRCDDGAA